MAENELIFRQTTVQWFADTRYRPLKCVTAKRQVRKLSQTSGNALLYWAQSSLRYALHTFRRSVFVNVLLKKVFWDDDIQIRIILQCLETLKHDGTDQQPWSVLVSKQGETKWNRIKQILFQLHIKFKVDSSDILQVFLSCSKVLLLLCTKSRNYFVPLFITF